MSPHAVNSFVSDLVSMAQAMERVPQLESDLAEWQRMASLRTDRIVELETSLEASRLYAATLEQRLHDAEVAKDAAETMFLEADYRTARALDFVKAQFGAAGSLIQDLEPVKAKPLAEETVQEETKAFDDGGPYNEPIISEVKPIEAVPYEAKPDGHWNEPQGQSDTDPIPTTETVYMTESVSADTAKPLDTATGTTSWATPAALDTKSQPYAGRKYKDVPYYVPLDLWLDGGGNKLDYSY